MTATLNMEVIDELLALSEDGDPELLVDLIQMFLDDGPTKVASIREGVRTTDWERVEKAAHALKGSSGNLGASQVLADCEHIQMACSTHDYAKVPEHARNLERHLADADSALRELLQRLH